MTFVLDASLALAFCFREEATSSTEAVLESLEGARAVVPAIWVYEVTNGLIMGERRERITRAEARKLMAFLDALPIDVQPLPTQLTDAAQGLHSLATAHGLTAYDAAYLEVCQRFAAPLATMDGEGRRKGLKQAAVQAGIQLFATD